MRVMVMAVMEMRLHPPKAYELSELRSIEFAQTQARNFRYGPSEFRIRVNVPHYDPDESGLTSTALPS